MRQIPIDGNLRKIYTNIIVFKIGKTKFSYKSFCQTFFKKFAEFEAEPQSLSRSKRVFEGVWGNFSQVKKVSSIFPHQNYTTKFA